MSRAVCVITEGGVGATKRHEYTPIGIKFKSEGSKKSDVLISHFTINNRVRENDEIAYIQDIVSVEYLACIHNFQLSALDERGYELDGELANNTSISETRFVDVNAGRFKGNYALDFDAEDQEIKVPNAKAITRIDLSKQFDIFIHFTPNSTQDLTSNKPILWSFLDDVGASKKGLEIGINADTPSKLFSFMRFRSNLTESITGSIELNLDEPNLIRVFRGGDNIIRLEINGEPDGTKTETGSLQPTDSSTPLIFGSNKDNNAEYKGQIHQIRVYHGTTLTQAEADTIRQSRPSLFTMKFAGLIWDVDDKESYKIVKADSFSKQLVKQIFDAKAFGTGVNDNKFDISEIGNDVFKDILQEIVNTVETDVGSFVVKVKDSFKSTVSGVALQGNLIAIGSFLDIISILFLFSKTTFYITPRKLLIVETNSGHATDYTFDQDSSFVPYDITESEDNDTLRISKVILTSPISNILTATAKESVTGTRATLRKSIKQLDSTSDLDNLAFDLVTIIKTINTKHVIKINVLTNWVRFNHIVKIKNSKKNIDASFIVRQIEYEYPKSSTRISVNENDIDFFDITNNDISVQEGLLDTIEKLNTP